MPAALAELVLLALVIVCFALSLLAKGFIKALFSVLKFMFGWLPGAEAKLGTWEQEAAAAVAHAFGVAEHGIDAAIGASWHLLAQFTTELWHQITRVPALVAHIAHLLAHYAAAILHLRTLFHAAHAISAGLQGEVKTLGREIRDIEGRIKRLTREISTQGVHALRLRVGKLEGEIGALDSKVIPGLRHDVATAEAQAAAVAKNLTDNYAAIGTTALTGSVLWALSQAGLGGLNCDSNPFKNNKNACGLWGDLANLLAIAAIPLEIASLYELIRLAQTVTGDVTKGIEDLLNV